MKVRIGRRPLFPTPRLATENTESTDPRSPAPEVVFPPSPEKMGG